MPRDGHHLLVVHMTDELRTFMKSVEEIYPPEKHDVVKPLSEDGSVLFLRNKKLPAIFTMDRQRIFNASYPFEEICKLKMVVNLSMPLDDSQSKPHIYFNIEQLLIDSQCAW